MNYEQALLEEGVKPDDIKYKQHLTYETDHGFFTIEPLHGCVSLIHFYVQKDKRNCHTARNLLKALMAVVRLLGYHTMIINSNKEYLDKLIQYYFKVKPYAVDEGYNLYEVEIR